MRAPKMFMVVVSSPPPRGETGWASAEGWPGTQRGDLADWFSSRFSRPARSESASDLGETPGLCAPGKTCLPGGCIRPPGLNQRDGGAGKCALRTIARWRSSSWFCLVADQLIAPSTPARFRCEKATIHSCSVTRPEPSVSTPLKNASYCPEVHMLPLSCSARMNW